jgi:hypothetical protein
MHHWATAAALALITTTAPALARDEEPGAGDRRYLGTGSHLALELDFAHGSDDGVTLFGMQPIISGRFAVTPLIGLEATIPFTFVSVSGDNDSESDFDIGNVSLGFDYRVLVRRDQNLSIGATLALPTAQISDDDALEAIKDIVNYITAFASRGFYRAWLFAPENLSFVPHLRWVGYSGQLYTQAHVALPVFFETED